MQYRVRRIPGRKCWYVTWSECRRSRRATTGETDYAAARQFMLEFIRERNAPASGGAITVSAVLDTYLADATARGVLSIERLGYAATSLKARFGHMVLGEIDNHAVAGYRPDVSPWTRRKDLSVLSSALRLAGVPIRFSLGGVPPDRERFLDDAEQARLLDAAALTLHVETFCVLGLHTGARKGAILGLTWDRVDFARGLVSYIDPTRVETTKRRGVVPMTALVRSQLIKAREASQTEYVIEFNGRPVGNIKRAFRRTCERAGLIGVIPHDLRRTYATTLAMRGISLDRIADFLMADPRTVQKHYRKYQPEYLADVVAALDSAPTGAHSTREEFSNAR